MAASKTYCARSNYRFLPNDQALTNDPMIFELDESDVWSAAARSQSPEVRKASDSRISRKSSAATGCGNGRGGGPSSLPVNVPDWSKILKDEYMETRRKDSDEDYEEDDGDRIPPHEFLARTRISSFSVHEGIGRTLKGRDLSRVRNAIWQKTGFED
ncbi:hypothetical protein SASPL_120106 [Salvia splendens]|uniref:Senescence regulator S40 n=1 Tax=Salvia splendens TaxID=180675 RepID=A0A8X8XSJ5_SALSN|nr:uncharacterized protein LOC121810940 [Salvia splendens]KAG6417909.1 hypothetical protein SASPL_120106 [Salvia splendens]